MRTSQSGFSLLELVMVVLITTIMFGLVGTFSTSLEQTIRLRIEMNRVVDTLYQARALARSAGQCVAVNVQAHSITVSRFAQTDCTAPLGSTPAASPLITEFSQSVTMGAFSLGNPLIFDATGSTIYATPAQMVIADNAQSKIISVFPITGLIKIGAPVSIAMSRRAPMRVAGLNE